MCGIVGMISLDSAWINDKRKYMEAALIIDTLRGDDSTGIFYKRRSTDKNPEAGMGTAAYAKSVSEGYSFVNSENYLKAVAHMDEYWFMVGHNRASTVGASVVDNAHPFQEGDITMVHNGTLRSTHCLPKSQEELMVDVDSHAICHNLAIHDPEDAHEVFTILDGAFTLIWHDARDSSLNIVRNSERPLHMATTADGKVLYFASEAGQLQYLDGKLKLALGDIVYPQPGLHLKFKQDSLEPEAVKHTLTPKYGRGYGGGYGNNNHGYQQWWDDQYDDDDYVVSRPLAQPPQDNRVHLGGRRREIPQLSQEMLLKENLLVEDRLLFTPIARNLKEGNPHGFCVGTLDGLGLTAVIHQVEGHTIQAGFDRRWLVRPVALKYADLETPIIICKMVSTVGLEKDVMHSATSIPTETPSTDLPDVYPVGGDMWVGKQEWLELTAEGCTYCDAILRVEEAMQIGWIEDEMPLCPECNEDAYIMDRNGRELPWIE